MGRNDNTITELEQTLAESNMTIQALQEECDEYKRTITSFPTIKAQLELEATKAAESYQQEIRELKNLLVSTEQSVQRKVTESLASMGVETFIPEEILSATNTSPNGLYSKFLTLKGVEQTEFYRRHESQLSKFMSGKFNQI